MAAAFGTAERQARVGGDDGVDEHRAGADGAGQPDGPVGVGGPDGQPEAVLAGVGQRGELGVRTRDGERGDRAEGLLVERRDARLVFARTVGW